jgi:hypothetical protein
MPITSDGKEPDLKPFVAAIIEAAGKAVRKMRGGSASGTSQKDVAPSFQMHGSGGRTDRGSFSKACRVLGEARPPMGAAMLVR